MELVEVTGDQAMLRQIYALRVEAWRTNIDVPDHLVEWHDAHDDMARHWAIITDGIPIAAARLTQHASLAEIPDVEIFGDLLVKSGIITPAASLNRLVARPDMRGRGFARQLDEIRIGAAKDNGATCVIAAVGSVPGNRHRVQQLQALGFSILGTNLPYEEGLLAFANQMMSSTMILRFTPEGVPL